jgi:hypothetical protein
MSKYSRLQVGSKTNIELVMRGREKDVNREHEKSDLLSRFSLVAGTRLELVTFGL